MLPAHLQRRVRALQSATETLPLGGPTVDPRSLIRIAAAYRDFEPIRFAYRGRDGVRSSREVEPRGLVNLGRRWYLVAWDRGRGDWRGFRVDRLAGLTSTGARFASRRLPAKDAAAFVEKSLSAVPYRYQACVTLHAPAEAVRAQVPSRWGTVKPVSKHSCEFRTADDDLDWLAVRIAVLGVDFEVNEPPELVEHLRVMAERLARSSTGSPRAR